MLILEQVAGLVSGEMRGTGSVKIRGVAPIHEAGPEELGFLVHKRYAKFLDTTEAGAVLASEELAPLVTGRPCVSVSEPHRALATLLNHFHPPSNPAPYLHPTSLVDPTAILGPDVTLGAYTVVGPNARVGARCVLHEHVTVGEGVTLGDSCVIYPQVTLYPGTILGDRVIVHAGTRIGVDGYGYTFVDGEHRKVPQVGTCVIGSDVEIGANCTLDRGSIGRTVIGQGTKIDNLVHIAHNVHIGPRSLLTAQVGIAGSTRVGEGAVFGGQSGVVGHVEVGAGAQIGAQAGVIGNVGEGETVLGYPARERREFLRTAGMVRRLPELSRRVRDLEERIGSRASSDSDPEDQN